ncbi:MAG TPA: hypothetical protein VI011_05430 [Asanoa sp.]
MYLDRSAFGEFPADRRAAPFIVDGTLRTGEPCGELTPVLWLTLRRYGLAVRGPAVDALDIPVDRAALRRYSLENLRDDWQPIAAGIRRDLAAEPADAPVDGGDVAWCVLGPARLHTLAHGDVIAKAAAATYLGRLFPQRGPLADRAVRWRAGHAETSTATDLRAAGHSIDTVVEDAWNRWAE